MRKTIQGNDGISFVRITTFDAGDCIKSASQFRETFLVELRKSSFELAARTAVKIRSVRVRTGPESLGLTVRFYTTNPRDIAHIENVVKRCMLLKIGLYVFLKCRVIKRRLPSNVIVVPFRKKRGTGIVRRRVKTMTFKSPMLQKAHL